MQTRELMQEETAEAGGARPSPRCCSSPRSREAILLADRVAVLTHAAARVKSVQTIDLPRPRQCRDLALRRKIHRHRARKISTICARKCCAPGGALRMAMNEGWMFLMVRRRLAPSRTMRPR